MTNQPETANKPEEPPGQPRKRRGRRRRIAAALRYATGKTPLPLVVASGHGALAERIIAIASENNVPLAQDIDLAEALARLEIGDAIPAEVVAAVAALLGPLLKIKPSSGASEPSQATLDWRNGL